MARAATINGRVDSPSTRNENKRSSPHQEVDRFHPIYDLLAADQEPRIFLLLGRKLLVGSSMMSCCDECYTRLQTMTRFASVMCLLIAALLVGCGGSGEPTNVAEGAAASEIADYEALIQEAEELDDAEGENEEE